MTSINIVGIWADADYAHATEFENVRRALNGCGVSGATFNATVTGADRNVTLPAITGIVPNGSGTNVAFSYAGAVLTHDVGDANPRLDLGVFDFSDNTAKVVKGTATAETGNVAEAPAPAMTSDQMLLYVQRVEANASVITVANFRPRAVDVSGISQNPFDLIRTQFRANRRLVAEFGAKTISATDGGSTGFRSFNASGTVTDVGGEAVTEWAAGGSEASAGIGPGTGSIGASPAHSPRMLLRILFPASSADLTDLLAGFWSSESLTANGAYLRIATTGNVFFVTRQGGTETTTDLGVLSRTTVLGFEIETADAGVTWICRNQAGTALATHTTNVPTAATGLRYGVIATIATNPHAWGVAYCRVEGTFA